MFENVTQKIETPPEAKPTPGAAQIFTMPEKFRGLAARVLPPAIKPAAVPAAAPAKPAPPPPPKPVLRKKGMAKSTKAMLIAGAVLLVVLASAGAYVYFSLKSVVPSGNVAANNAAKPNVSVNKPANTANNAAATTNQATTGSPFPNNSQPGRDSDSDGLTDVEEILYRTSSKKPDTDSDGFLDGNEVFHGYDPNAFAPATLAEGGVVKSFEVADDYSLNFPAVWTAVPEAKTGSVVFNIPSGETITLSWEKKEAATTLADWFSGTNPGADVKVSTGTTKNNYPYLLTEDQMTYYIDAGVRVATFAYQNTVKASVDYLATFEMMMNSLKYVESGVE